eukprot:Skav222809  [mRNA]  locus=scaffold1444:54383:56296:+ [translate_table: standard]
MIKTKLVDKLFEGPIDIIGDIHGIGLGMMATGTTRSSAPGAKAQCILGNHELNILRGERKHGNHWFFGGQGGSKLSSSC